MIEPIAKHPRDQVALIEPARRMRITYGELVDRVERASGWLRAAAGGRRLAFLAMEPDVEATTLYLACLRAGLPVCLAESDPEPLARLVAAYAPGLLLLPARALAPAGYRALGETPEGSYRAWARDAVGAGASAAVAEPKELHTDLAVLLTTSGSTGSPKLVRLTRGNLESNALAIGEYLRLSADERAIQSLPQHYSYGLSVLNSHLAAGGTIVLTPHSFMRPEFWSAVDEERCTSFAGVPYMYETLHRLRFDPARHATLRVVTQAGGGLRRDLTAHYHALAQRAGLRFFVMYGQTEATARISYVPPERLGEKIGSIGVAIPGGRLSLQPAEGGEGMMELVYQGSNVMWGYADSPADLALGDVQHGMLRTGDLGTMDAEGFFSVVGRLKRFAKLFGRRVSLEDVERELESKFPARVAAVDGGDRILLHSEIEGEISADTLGAHAARFLNVPPKTIVVVTVDALPLTAAGKKNYRALEGPR